jgi:predicted alpha/beta hydrolase family esterase
MRPAGLTILFAVVAVVSCTAGCGGSTNAQELSDGEMVDMGGWSLYLQCEGTGSPTVVLDAGLHSGHSVWARVEPSVARRTRTCSYDRSGVGQSELRPSRPALVPAEQVVDELHSLLDKADVPPPYVLVGHSLGGLNAQLFTARHRRDISGLVLVDPTSLEYFGRSQSEPELEGAAIGYDTAYDTVRSVRFRDRPVIVLVASASRAISEEEAGELAERSSNSLLVRTETGHRIQTELPKVVVEAIDRVVDSARSQAAIPACRTTRLERLGGRCLDP